MKPLTFFTRLYFTLFALVLLGSLSTPQRLLAQEPELQKPGRLLPPFLRVEGRESGAEGALGYLRRTYKLDARVGFTESGASRDELGFTHIRYRQTYDGYPVSGGMLLVHLDRDGRVQSINGDVFAVPQAKPAVPAVTEAAARTAALRKAAAQEYLWEGDTARLPAAYAAYKKAPQGALVWAPQDGKHGTEPMRLAWKFDVYASKPLKRSFLYIDAATGAVLWEEDRIREGNANGTANTLFSGVRAIVTDSTSPTNFRLRDATRGGGVRTWDLNTGTSVSSAVDFTDADNYWNNTANFDRAAGDVHWGHEKVYDYFDTAHNRQSFNGANAMLNGYVHYDVNMINAFWDGTALYYGDGDASQGYSPLTCLDIVGHEFTHGVTEFTADLIYSYQSGALNESFSDIFGNTIERVVKPTTANWKVGEEISTTGTGLRNMANPNQYGDPDTYLGTNWYTGSLDNGGVHVNSGVQNFWYHILAAGDTGTNDLGNAYSVPGIGIHKAAKIAYRSLTMYLTPTSQYADARFYAIQAAKDLYGACSQELIQTTNAWYAVGVGAAYTPGTAVSFTATPTFSCHLPVTVQFTNTSASVLSSQWTFGNGSTSTLQSPSTTYTTNGQYSVKLKVTRCNSTVDSVTYTNFITADTSATMCDTVTLTTSTQQSFSGCSGVIVDNGGANGDYSDNVSSGVLVTATSGSYVRFKITQIGMESCCDYVAVYNGTTTSAPLIGSYTGSTLPNNGGWIYTTGNQFLVRFYSDGSVTGSGFVMQYECMTTPPAVSFYSADTVTCTPQVSFVNTTAPTTGVTWSWSFGDGTTSTLANPTKTYAAQGTYTVKLKGCNSFGCDSLIRTAYIKYDTTQSLCTTTVLPNSGTTTVVRCTGTITDDGGPNGNYSYYSYGGTAVSTTGGNQYRFKFTQMKLQTGAQVSVYNGSNAYAPLLATYTGNTLPNNGGWIYTSGPQFYVQFYNYYGTPDSGFKMTYECLNSVPVASFYSPDTVSCDNSVVFVNTTVPTATSYLWSFGDGTTSTLANPTKLYSAQGTYTIKLKTCNSIGCDSITKTAYIKYDTTLGPCTTTPTPSSGTTTVVRCTGTVTDNGGPNGNYSTYANGGVAVSTTGGNQYRFKFTQMKLQSGVSVSVYNGSNTSAPLLATYTGTTLPNNGNWIYTTGSQFYVRFYSYYGTPDSGFKMDYECLNSVPVASFYSPDTVSCDNSVAFVSTTVPTPTSYLWSFGDGTTSTLANPTKLYSAQGTYTIKLKTCSSAGCDSMTKTAYIKYDTTQMVCQTTILPYSGSTTVTRCSGYVTDPGGWNGNYSNYSYGTAYINTTAGSYYRYRFLQLRTDTLDDVVTVYNGSPATGTVNGVYSGKTLPNNGGWFYTTGSQLTVVFSSNYTSVDSGFKLQYECISGAPIANFYSPDTVSCDNSVAFVTTSSGATSYQWTFGDGTTSTVANPTKLYASQGTYTVKLKVCNGTGCDSITRTAYIKYDTTLGPCTTTATPVSGTTTVVRCTGTITDNGGPNGNYTSYTYGGVSVSTTGGNQYRFKFTQMKLQYGAQISVYNGSNTSAPLLATYTGTTLPNSGGWIYTNGPQFYVQFTNYYSTVDSGFKLDYECQNVAPTPSFYSPDTISCDPSVVFVNTTSPAATSYLWSFGDGTTSTLVNPTKFYTAQGTYTVKLKACNTAGCDSVTRTAYIKYDTTLLPCNTTVLPTSGTTSVSKCNGLITDNGGLNGNYWDYTNAAVAVSTTPGSTYRFKFNQLRTESCCDYIRVYDGANASAPLIGQYQGIGLPNSGGWIYTSGPQFFLQFVTDGSVVDSGFVLQYECLSGTQVAAGFSSPDTATCTGTVSFANTSTNATTYTWNFGDGTTSTLANPVKTYTLPGNYNISLTACSSNGACNTVNKIAYIKFDPFKAACGNYLQPTGSGQGTISGVCKGSLYDDGGFGPYSNNSNSSTLITGTAGQNLRLSFRQFHMQAGDFVRLYDGPTTAAPLLAELSGNGLPVAGGAIWTRSNQVLVVQNTDGSANAPGFVLDWTCVQQPKDSFSFAILNVDTVHYCHGIFSFDAQQVIPAGVTAAEISTGDGAAYGSAGPVAHTYTTSGTFTPRLKLTTATSTFYEYAALITSPLVALGTVPDTVMPNADFSLVSATTGASSTSWYIDGNLAGQTSPLVTRLSTAGSHTVSLVASNGTCTDTMTRRVWVRSAAGILTPASGSGFQLYPNPAVRSLTLTADAVSGGSPFVGYRIRNAAGQLVLEGKAPVTAGRVQHTLSLPELASGLYSFTLEAGPAPQTVMFRVQQ